MKTSPNLWSMLPIRSLCIFPKWPWKEFMWTLQIVSLLIITTSFASKSNVAQGPFIIFAPGHDKILFHFVVLAIKKLNYPFLSLFSAFRFLIMLFFHVLKLWTTALTTAALWRWSFLRSFLFWFLRFFPTNTKLNVSIANPKSCFDGARRKW